MSVADLNFELNVLKQRKAEAYVGGDTDKVLIISRIIELIEDDIKYQEEVWNTPNDAPF
jgi:hypothetical protein